MKLRREKFNYGYELKGKYRKIEALQFEFDVHKNNFDLKIYELYAEYLNSHLNCDHVNFYLKYDLATLTYTVTFKLVNQYHTWTMTSLKEVVDDINTRFRDYKIRKEVVYLEDAYG